MPKLLNIDLFLKNILVLIFLQVGLSFACGMDLEKGGGEPSGTVGSAVLVETTTVHEEERLSPTCRSPIEEGCGDARVYRDSFGDLANAWHRRKKDLLIEICKKIGSDRDRRNLALAGVNLTYQEEGELKHAPIVDLEPLFISGVKSALIRKEAEGKKEVKTIETAGHHLHLSALEDYLPGEPEVIANTLRRNLSELYDQASEDKTKLSLDILESWKKDFKKHGRSAYKREYDALPLNFFHSEQALRLYLLAHMDIICNQLIRLMPQPGTSIKRFIVRIVTFNEMCRDCAITYLLSLEQKILETIFRGEMTKHGLHIADDFSILIEVSGLKIFDRPKDEYLDRQRPYHDTIINTSIFPPHIAHHWLSREESEENLRQISEAREPVKAEGAAEEEGGSGSS